MNLIVFDLELTCWGKDETPGVTEIIEIGAVRMNLREGILDTFQSYVKPSRNAKISAYCTQLTGIQQKDFKGVGRFPEIYAHFVNFCGSKYKGILSSWGQDHIALGRECLMHGVASRHLPEHLNASLVFQLCYGEKVGLNEAMGRLEIKPYGRAHSALDDAINAARVLEKCLGAKGVSL